MNNLQDMIVDYLVGPFITGRPVDKEDLARLLKKSFPEMPLDELTATVSRVAGGIGVRIKRAETQRALNPTYKKVLSQGGIYGS